MFTVGLENLGPDPAQAVAVGDLLRPGLTFVSATPSVGTYDAATGVWTVGDVQPGATPRTRPWPSRRRCGSSPAADAVGTFTNTAPRTAPRRSPSTRTRRTTRPARPSRCRRVPADVSVTKTVSPAQVTVGQSVTFTHHRHQRRSGPRPRTSSSPTPCRPASHRRRSPTVVLDHRPGRVVPVRHDGGGNERQITVNATATVAGSYTNVASVSAADPRPATGQQRRRGRRRRHRGRSRPTAQPRSPHRRAASRPPDPALQDPNSELGACSSMLAGIAVVVPPRWGRARAPRAAPVRVRCAQPPAPHQLGPRPTRSSAPPTGPRRPR